MADFVDNFFGNGFDDPKSQAVMALASGLMGGDWRKGVNGYLGAMGTAGEYNSKKQLQQMQKTLNTASTGNESRVESLKKAVASGEYKVNSEAVARKMFSFEADLDKRLG